MNIQLTPNYINQLDKNEIFVFGSNLQGNHAGGAARIAKEKFGAVMGKGVGLQGNSYAIPTMQGGVDTIKPYVDDFIEYAKEHRNFHFYVTKIGCGIAGFSEEEMAPLFMRALLVENISLPQSFFQIITSQPEVWRDLIKEDIMKFLLEVLNSCAPFVATDYKSNLSHEELLSIEFHVKGFTRFIDALGEVYFSLLYNSSPLLKTAVKLATINSDIHYCYDYGQYILATEIKRKMEELYLTEPVQKLVCSHPELAQQNPDRCTWPLTQR